MTKRPVGQDGIFKAYSVDDQGPGGAFHEYVIESDDGSEWQELLKIKFQKGPLKETGLNGVPDVLLGIILFDRLRAFQAGSHPDPLNNLSMQGLNVYLTAQAGRTAQREERGVEGTNKP